MSYLSINEIVYLHERIIETSGGSHGIRNLGGLESALALPRQSFGNTELYPSVIDKSAILCFSIINNHPWMETNQSDMPPWKLSLF